MKLPNSFKNFWKAHSGTWNKVYKFYESFPGRDVNIITYNNGEETIEKSQQGYIANCYMDELEEKI